MAISKVGLCLNFHRDLRVVIIISLLMTNCFCSEQAEGEEGGPAADRGHGVPDLVQDRRENPSTPGKVSASEAHN